MLGRWWRRWPHANVGLATGIVFDALDIDGPAGLTALRQRAPTVELRLPGPLVATGGGGWHHWFNPTGLGNRPPHGLAHVDWRGRGGCVLAPPSRHISGCSYRWLRGLDQVPLPEVPAALRELLDPDRPAPTRPADRPRRPHPATRTDGECWPPSWPPSAGPPPDSATTPSTAPPSRSTATSPAASSTTRKSPSPSPRPPSPSAWAGRGRRTLASARTAGLANPRTVPAGPGPSTEEAGP